MLFMITYQTTLATDRAGQARFKETAGARPPAKITKAASYHRVDGGGGFVLAETDDPIALGQWCNQWTDLIILDCRPVLTDEQIMQVLG